MKKIITTIVSIVFLGVINDAVAQQIPLGNLYNSNKYIINPAYAGQKECTQAYLTHRSQWTGIKGAPVTTYLSGSAYLGKNIGLGLKLYNDKTSILTQNYGVLSFAYHLKTGELSKLSFGLSAGVFNNSVNQSAIIASDMTDDIFQNNSYKPTFETDFGIAFNTERLSIGVSVPRFIETTSKLKTPVDKGVFTLKRHALSFVSYDIKANENLEFTPSIMTRWAPGIDFQYDVNAELTVKKILSVGVGYREKAGILVRLGVVISDRFMVNYGYEFLQSGITSRSNGSHEIRLGFRLCKKTTKQPEKAILAEEETIPIEIVEEEIVQKEKEVFDSVPTNEPEEEEEVLTEEEAKTFETFIQYGFNSSDALAKSTKTLNKVIEILATHPSLNLELIGHTCNLGGVVKNAELSVNRAKEVKAYLVSKGISTDRISVKGLGENHPLVPNDSEENRIKNRRVAFKIAVKKE